MLPMLQKRMKMTKRGRCACIFQLKNKFTGQVGEVYHD